MKNKITSFIVACLTFLITSCATESSLSFQQQRCEQLQKSFPDMVICLKAAVASGQVKEPRGTFTGFFNLNRGPSSELKLYMLRAEQLSIQVKNGSISELDARVELQKLYVEIENLRGQHPFQMDNQKEKP